MLMHIATFHQRCCFWCVSDYVC